MDTEDLNPNRAKTADLSALRIHRPTEERVRSLRWLRILPWLLIPAALVIGYFILLGKVERATPVETTTVRLVKGVSTKALMSANGYVVAQRQSAVASKGTGRLIYLGVSEGDQVKKEQVIARIEYDDVAAALDLARANFKLAVADTLDAAADYARFKKLHEAKLTTQELYDKARTQYDRSLANLEARRAAVASAQINLDNTYVRAPFDGTVLTKIAEIGDIVAPFGSSANSRAAVVTLADMSSLEVEADVSEANIQKVTLNQPCEIVLDAYPEIRYKAHVKNIVPTAERSSATIMTRIAFERLDSLVFPEMSAKVYFLNPAAEHNAAAQPEKPYLGVAKTAVIDEGGRKFVFVVKGDRLEERKITVGKEIESTLEVLSGLAEGEAVVLVPAGDFKTGTKVKMSE